MSTKDPKLAELEAAEAQAAALRRAHERLAEAQRNLDLLRKVAEERKDFNVNYTWRPRLILQKAKPYSYSDDITVQVEIPFGVVQQQLVYAVDAARREVIALGGMA